MKTFWDNFQVTLDSLHVVVYLESDSYFGELQDVTG